MARGIHYLVDETGRKTAVVIDLKAHGELWEDFYDAVLAERRKDEPRLTLDQLKRSLKRKGKLAPDA